MEASVERLEKNQVVLEVKVEPQRVEKALDQVYRSIANRANIPGFRRGKAPRRLLENYFGREYILNQALDQVIPEAYAEAVEKTQIEPIDRPEVELVQAEQGQPLIFRARVEVKPEVQLGEYRGLTATKRVRTVGEEDVNRQLENLRDQFAQLVDVGEDGLAEGDLAVIDYEATVEGKPFTEKGGKSRAVIVGGSLPVPNLSLQMVGMKAGEEREIRVTLPEDYAEKQWAGKEAVFRVRLSEAKRRQLAELDDEFAKDVSEFETLEELRADIANRLAEAYSRQAEQQVREELAQKAAEAATVEVPASLVERRLGAMVAELEDRLRQQGMNLEEYLRMTNGTMEDVRARFRPEAEAEVKRELVLEAIAQKEGLKVEEAELDREVETLAQRSGREAAAIKESLPPEWLEGMRRSLLYRKVVDFLVENASIEVSEA
ncbi:MAG: trigger factor [Clostridia bacterium]|jgi:trigger factor|nr:trigger factor [Clostridia bacterium]MDH7573609.1 trigger factor [Clostridia bacterium]